MKATVTSKGQITIPLPIRKQAHIEVGMQLDFQVESDGSIIIRSLSHDISEIKGIVKPKKKPVSLRDMKKAISDSATKGLK